MVDHDLRGPKRGWRFARPADQFLAHTAIKKGDFRHFFSTCSKLSISALILALAGSHNGASGCTVALTCVP